MRVSLLPLVVLATAANALHFKFPVVQQPLVPQSGEGPQLILSSDELALATVGHTVYPPPNASELVEPVLKSLQVSNLEKNLWTFTSFLTRYYLQPGGRSSQKWLLKQIRETIANSSSTSPAGVREFEHKWPQNSIIARINGSTHPDEVVILGAHLDSSNHANPELRSPGADDDGSGTVTILETFRGLLAANFTPARSVEFHWYAAEEVGGLGSIAIAGAYRAQNATVVAQLQFDATAWIKNGTEEEVGLYTNWADLGLVHLQKQLIGKYLDIPYYEDTLPGNAGSDHMSWTRAGYPAVYVAESRFAHFSPWFHTPEDRIDKSPEFSFDHMLHFSKLGAAYAIEVGGWKKD